MKSIKKSDRFSSHLLSIRLNVLPFKQEEAAFPVFRPHVLLMLECIYIFVAAIKHFACKQHCCHIGRNKMKVLCFYLFGFFYLFIYLFFLVSTVTADQARDRVTEKRLSSAVWRLHTLSHLFPRVISLF